MVRQGRYNNYSGLKTGDVVMSMDYNTVFVIRGFRVINEKTRYVNVIIEECEDSDGWISTWYVNIDEFQNEFYVIEI